jgi:hypothetical protein
MTEKRRYHRMQVEIPMSFCVPPRKKKLATTTLDISGTGVAFLTTTALQVRQELLMYLLLPVKQQIEIHGKVVRLELVENSSGPFYRAGVKIMDPIKFDEKKFLKFYAQKLLEYFGKKAHS